MKRITGRIKVLLGVLVFIGISLSGIQARQEGSALGQMDTIWPGIRFELMRIERIPPDRLLVAVRLIATRQAPADGSFIGTKPAGNIPVGEELSSRYAPRPFSLATSQMIEEQTNRKYPALRPLETGKTYFPSEIMTTLRPGQAEILTIQFAAPPVPPPIGGRPAKQTVSFLLPSAKGPIVNVPVPALAEQEPM